MPTNPYTETVRRTTERRETGEAMPIVKPINWLRRGVKEFLARGGLRLALPFCPDHAHIVTFHGLIDGPPRYATENTGGKHISVEDFRRIVDWLRRHFPLVHLHDVIDSLAGGKPLPRNSVAITFDDGYESNYLLAYPLLRKHAIPATVFLTTRFLEERVPLWTCRVEYAVGRSQRTEARVEIEGTVVSGTLNSDGERVELLRRLKNALKATDQPRLDEYCGSIEDQLGVRLDLAGDDEPARQPLSWKQVSEMADSGLISFGGHSHRHVILGRCQEESMREEVRLCNDVLRTRLGDAQRTFAYPNGKPGDYSQTSHEAVAAAGFSCALITVEGPCTVGRTSPFGAPRVSVSGDTEPWSLVGRLVRPGSNAATVRTED